MATLVFVVAAVVVGLLLSGIITEAGYARRWKRSARRDSDVDFAPDYVGGGGNDCATDGGDCDGGGGDGGD